MIHVQMRSLDAAQTRSEARACRLGRRIDWDRVPFGELSDTHLARILGVSRQAVAQQRYRRGILVGRIALGAYVRGIILDALGTHVPKPFGFVYEAVLAEFGSIGMRQVHRHLVVLIRSGRIERVELSCYDEQSEGQYGPTWSGYLRTEKETDRCPRK